MSVQTAWKHCEDASFGEWPDLSFQVCFQEVRTGLAYRLLLFEQTEAINTFAAQIKQ